MVLFTNVPVIVSEDLSSVFSIRSKDPLSGIVYLYVIVCPTGACGSCLNSKLPVSAFFSQP